MSNQEYARALLRGQRRHGAKFSEVGLDTAPQFRRWYHGARVKVTNPDGWTRTGVVSMTAGWVPVFLLVHRSSDTGSSDTLSKDDRVVAVWNGRKYVPVGTPQWLHERVNDPCGTPNRHPFVGGYTDRAGIDNRANGAMCALDLIISDYHIPPAVRLAWIAERMAQEPILTDDSPAAHEVRAEAARLAEMGCRFRERHAGVSS